MNKRLKILTMAVLFLSTAALTFISCDKDDDPELNPIQDPATVKTIIELVSGGNQTNITEATLDNDIEVLVKDLNGNPYEGEIVYFAATQGSVSASTVTTGANGKASVKWTLGEIEGPQSLIVTGTLTLTVAPITVTATAEYRPVLGDYYAGGIIFYIDETEKHGFCCRTGDEGDNLIWGCEGTITGATGTAIGTGAQNTIDIVDVCSLYTNIAAVECDDAANLSYSDYFLPSKDELNLMYNNKAYINASNDGDPLINSWYWSSSEKSGDAAWAQNFETGEQASGYKSSEIYARAIRAF